MEARMSSADLVQRNGRGSRLQVSIYRSMAASSFAVERWAPRLICRSVNRAKKRYGTWSIHDADVGVKSPVPARPLGEPVLDQLGLVARRGVHDDVDIEVGGHWRSLPRRGRRGTRVPRCRLMQLPMTVPAATSRAANSVVVPERLSSWVRRSAWPGRMGSIGWVRPSDWSGSDGRFTGRAHAGRVIRPTMWYLMG